MVKRGNVERNLYIHNKYFGDSTYFISHAMKMQLEKAGSNTSWMVCETLPPIFNSLFC